MRSHGEIGGYFELELRPGDAYHTQAIALNTGRNGLEYVLRAKRFTKLYLPHFICYVVLQPAEKLGIEVEHYAVDENLDPVFDKELGDTEAFLYVNYFGLKHATVQRLSQSMPNLIIDSSQAFFHMPLKGVDTFYSARKFFGVPDGGYLYTDTFLHEDFDQDLSYDKVQHLVQRIDQGAPSAYKRFVATDDSLDYNNIETMSAVTRRILHGVDYDNVRAVRERNFRHLHAALAARNSLSVVHEELCGPMHYPFLLEREDLRARLIENRIYVPTFWPNVFQWCSSDSIECYLSRFIIPLPIDQRYDLADMDVILNVLSRA